MDDKNDKLSVAGLKEYVRSKTLFHDFGLSLQHILIGMTTIISVPIVFSSILGLSKANQTHLVQMSLLVSGIMTIIHSQGFKKIGARTQCLVGPDTTVLAIAFKSIGQVGLSGFFGILLMGGVLSFGFAKTIKYWYKRISKPLIASVLMVFCIMALPASLDLFLGGIGSPEYGTIRNILIGSSVLTFAMFLYHNGYGFIRNAAVGLSILFGIAISIPLGIFDTAFIAKNFIFYKPLSMSYTPTVELKSLIIFIPGLIVLIFKQIADLIVSSEWLHHTDKDKEELIQNGLYGNTIGYVLSGLFGSLPTSFINQNLGLAMLINDRNKRTTVLAGIVLCLLSLMPNFVSILLLIPAPIIGAVMLITLTALMQLSFIMIKSMEWHPKNSMILCFSTLTGIIGFIHPEAVESFPITIQLFFESGITMAVFCGVILQIVIPEPES